MPLSAVELSAADAVRWIRAVARVAVRREEPRHATRCDADDPLAGGPLRGAAASRAEAARRRERRLRAGDAVGLRHGREIDLDHRLDRAVDRSNRVGQHDHRHVPTELRCVTEGLAWASLPSSSFQAGPRCPARSHCAGEWLSPRRRPARLPPGRLLRLSPHRLRGTINRPRGTTGPVRLAAE